MILLKRLNTNSIGSRQVLASWTREWIKDAEP